MKPSKIDDIPPVTGIAQPTYGQPEANATWRGLVATPCVGGGWTNVEVAIPAKDVAKYTVDKSIPHGNHRAVISARAREWWESPEFSRKWWSV